MLFFLSDRVLYELSSLFCCIVQTFSFSYFNFNFLIIILKYFYTEYVQLCAYFYSIFRVLYMYASIT